MPKKYIVSFFFVLVAFAGCAESRQDGPESLPDEAPVVQPVPTVVLPRALSVEELPGRCQPADPSQVPYQNADFGYCMIYPAYLEIEDVFPDMVVLAEPQPGDRSQGSGPSLLISVGDNAEGRSVEDIAQGIADEVSATMPDLVITRTQTLLGGLQAEIIEGLSADSRSRQIFAVYQDEIYRLALSWPPGMRSSAEVIWDLVIASFSFLPPES